jgi:predicted signal transduction protein with EAL and GGDEF domain
MKVVAEGVETQSQKDFLAAIGCHEMQGFLCSAPLPVEQAEALLASQGAVMVEPIAEPVTLDLRVGQPLKKSA